MNEQTMNIVKQLKDKLMLAGSADEIRKLIADAGGKDIGCWASDYHNKNDAGYATNTCQDCKVTLRDKALHEKECPVCHKTYEYFLPPS